MNLLRESVRKIKASIAGLELSSPAIIITVYYGWPFLLKQEKPDPRSTQEQECNFQAVTLSPTVVDSVQISDGFS